jgi:hypothetical protein
MYESVALVNLGDFAAGERLRAAKAAAEEMGAAMMSRFATTFVTSYVHARNATEEQEALLRELRTTANTALQASGVACLDALIAYKHGNFARAASASRAAADATAHIVPSFFALASACHAAAQAALGDRAAAVSAAKTAHRCVADLGSCLADILILSLSAGALVATGDHAEARAVITVARDRILGRAARISDPALRRSYLELVHPNAEVLALAETMIHGG